MGGGAGLVDPIKPVVPRVGDRGKQRPRRKFPDPRGDDDDGEDRDDAPEPPSAEDPEAEAPSPSDDDEAGHQVDIVVRGPLPTGAILAQPPGTPPPT